MKIIDAIQGSQEWLDLRAKHQTASEASVMMGASKKVTRTELLRMKATGDEREFSDWVKNVLFENGHAVEAAARPIAEQIIGEELYPVTATDDDGYLLASFDGVTLMEDIIWECKQWNEAKAECVTSGPVPEEDYWQVVQQLVVSGAEKCLYMVTDGTPERTVYTWMSLIDDDVTMLNAGWKQFIEDMENYQHIEDAPKLEGKAPETLPALHIELQGMVTASNLIVFKQTAMAVIDSVKTDLQTDSDFADAEKAVKWCGDVESRLKAAKEHALSQTQSIDDLFRTLDEISEEARRKRLDLEKLVKSRKESIRVEIKVEAETALRDHIDKINATFGGKIRLPDVRADFASVMKNKRTVASLRDAVNTELANLKIATSTQADSIRLNLETLRTLAKGQETLFSDAQQLVLKANDDLIAVIKARIQEHKEAEEQRLEAERAKIRQEEEERANKAAEAERVRIRIEEQAKLKAEQKPKVIAGDPPSSISPTASTADASPAAKVAPAATIKPAKTRPTDAEIIEVLTLHYRVHESKVIEWLLDLDLETEGNKLQAGAI